VRATYKIRHRQQREHTTTVQATNEFQWQVEKKGTRVYSCVSANSQPGEGKDLTSNNLI
jgi:hypothetical protein